MTEDLTAVIAEWRQNAITSREEATRIRLTVKEATGAEERCNVRAEVWDKCADRLAALVIPSQELREGNSNERANCLRDALCQILSATGAVPHEIPRLAKEALARDNVLFDAEVAASRPLQRAGWPPIESEVLKKAAAAVKAWNDDIADVSYDTFDDVMCELETELNKLPDPPSGGRV